MIKNKLQKKRLENIEAFLFGTLDYNYETGQFDLTPPSEFAPSFVPATV